MHVLGVPCSAMSRVVREAARVFWLLLCLWPVAAEADGGPVDPPAPPVESHESQLLLGADELCRKGEVLVSAYPLQMDRVMLLEAVGYFKQALTVSPVHLRAFLGLAQALAELKTSGKDGNDSEGAEYWILKAKALRPEDPTVLDAMAFVDWRLGRVAQAEGEAREAIHRDPQAARHFLRLGQVLGQSERLEDHREAVTILQHALALHPTLREEWHISIELSGIYRGLGERDAELRAGERAIELDPTAWRGWYNYTGTLLRLTRYDEAITAGQRALSLKDDDWTRSHLVEAYLHKGLTAPAADQLPRIHSAEALAHLSSVFRERHDPSQAVELARKAVALDPHDPYTQQQAGLSWEASGDRERAIEAFTAATRIQPTGRRDRQNIAIAYDRWARLVAFDQQRCAEAVPLYQKALETDPANMWPYDGLGACYEHLGRLSDARQAWRKLLDGSPSGEWAERVRRKLALTERPPGP